MEKRKDSKGKKLKEGESQRKDGVYQYRYTTKTGKRKYIYSKDLKELRKKEDEIQKMQLLCGNVFDSEITMAEIIDRYFDLHKSSLRSDTRINHQYLLGRFKDDPFWHKPANSISTSDAKQWTKELAELGWGYQTINSFLAVIRPAFQSACEDDVILRNPFAFSLSKIMVNNKKPREALTEQEYKNLIDFVRVDSQYRYQVDVFVILYETGLRAGEFCGLTLEDVDFKNNQIRVNHQLLYNSEEGYHIREPKSKAGTRVIPMSENARTSFINALRNRPVFINAREIDGYKDFFFLTKQGNPQLPDRLESLLRRVVKSYNEVHEDQLPNITPHVFRHTFCTRLIASGLDIKSVQYLMGHSTTKMTLDVYAHVNPQVATEQFLKLGQGAG